MTSIELDAEVIKQFPEAQIRFVVARGVRNIESEWNAVRDRLADLESRLASGQWQAFTEDDPQIASWHGAYREFGTNPRRFRPSVDALSRRLTKSGQLPRINPAVDAYNVISVSHGLPAGAFDLGALRGEVRIRLSQTGDTFVPLGEADKVEPVPAGEVVYAQGPQVLTRSWNHRDCDQTKVTRESSDIVFILERVSETACPDDAIVSAQQDLAALVRPYATEVTVTMIDADAPRTELPAS